MLKYSVVEHKPSKVLKINLKTDWVWATFTGAIFNYGLFHCIMTTIFRLIIFEFYDFLFYLTIMSKIHEKCGMMGAHP